MLAKEKKEVEDLRRSMLCVNCRTPVRDVGPSPNAHQNSKPLIKLSFPTLIHYG